MKSPSVPSAFRMALAIIVGYGVAAAIVMAGTMVASSVVGLPMDARPTTGYLVANVAVSFFAAVCAGYACASLAPEGRRAITVGLLIFLFLAGAVFTWRTSIEARQQPPGYLPLVTLLGVVGLWAGVMIERAKHGKASSRR